MIAKSVLKRQCWAAYAPLLFSKASGEQKIERGCLAFERREPERATVTVAVCKHELERGMATAATSWVNLAVTSTVTSVGRAQPSLWPVWRQKVRFPSSTTVHAGQKVRCRHGSCPLLDRCSAATFFLAGRPRIDYTTFLVSWLTIVCASAPRTGRGSLFAVDATRLHLRRSRVDEPLRSQVDCRLRESVCAR